MRQLCIIRGEWDLKNRNVPFQEWEGENSLRLISSNR